MPHLRFRGMEKETLIEISTQLLDNLESIIGCPRDYFTLEYIESTYVFDGVQNAGKWPYVEVLWFDRGPEVMKQTAKMITNMLKKDSEIDVTVHFTNLQEKHYFENGNHF